MTLINERQLTKIFQSVDKDKSGFILIEELLPFVESVLSAWSEEIFYGPNNFDKKYGELNYFYQIISNTKFDGWATLKKWTDKEMFPKAPNPKANVLMPERDPYFTRTKVVLEEVGRMLMAIIDKNGDKKLSLEEWLAVDWDQLFPRMREMRLQEDLALLQTWQGNWEVSGRSWPGMNAFDASHEPQDGLEIQRWGGRIGIEIIPEESREVAKNSNDIRGSRKGCLEKSKESIGLIKGEIFVLPETDANLKPLVPADSKWRVLSLPSEVTYLSLTEKVGEKYCSQLDFFAASNCFHLMLQTGKYNGSIISLNSGEYCRYVKVEENSITILGECTYVPEQMSDSERRAKEELNIARLRAGKDAIELPASKTIHLCFTWQLKRVVV